ncbi:MAG: hypothetical protein KC613_18470 [Myxococcales bacterium]|nr:hypothetical protein [Myxococcales bacterium]
MSECYQAVDAEMAVIGAAFLDGSVVESAGVDARDFTDENHRILWRAMQALRAKGAPVDAVAVVSELERSGMLGRIQWPEGPDVFVALMADAAATSINAAYHGSLMTAATRCRDLRDLLATEPLRALKTMLDGSGTSEAVDAAAEVMVGALMKFAQGGDRKSRHTLSGATRAALGHIEKVHTAFLGGRVADGVIPWGIEPVDAQMPMMEAGELYGLCARSGEGKTMIAWQVARRSAMATGRITDYFTSEVDARGIATRHLSDFAQVDGRCLQSGALDDGAINRLLQATTRTGAPGGVGELVEIHDAAPTTLEGIASMLRLVDATRAEARKGGLVVVDYWQRVKSTGAPRGMSREQYLNHIAGELKTLAQIIRRPILLLAQLNREAYKQAGGRARVDQIRESSGLEQECTTLLGFNWPSKVGVEAPADYCELYAMKGRTGASGVIPLRHVGKFQRVEPWTGEPWAPGRQSKNSNGEGWR